jgi:hypothetical protein
MAASLAGLILRGTLVLWHWSESRDTVVYVPFPGSFPALVWSETLAGLGEWRRLPGPGLANVSESIERLAVEHGDGEEEPCLGSRLLRRGV